MSIEFELPDKAQCDMVIALAGNPNVGKSTVFNTLTGMKQHTGNWTGKTVENAQGRYTYKNKEYILVDLPGTYSLMAHSAEEEIARDFICFGNADAAIVVCDAVCLERNLNLVLQTMEITKNVVVCVNLMDEAKKKGIKINLKKLQKILGVPVVGTSARSGTGITELCETVSNLKRHTEPFTIRYLERIEEAVRFVEANIKEYIDPRFNSRWVAIQMLRGDDIFLDRISEYTGFHIKENEKIKSCMEDVWKMLSDNEITQEKFNDMIVSNIVLTAEGICNECVAFEQENFGERERRIDRILTNRITGIPIMLALLCLIFWITISGANVPSKLLADGLFWIQDRLTEFFMWMGAPDWLHGVLVLGVYRVLAWVVSVMLPPMAIFFPLFTLLEDLGYLPRVAFNLDHCFKKCRACGKQCLTMCIVCMNLRIKASI